MEAKAIATVGICDEYRRRARRLRAVYSHNPVKLQRSLAQLAGAQTRRFVSKPPRVAQEFADRVRGAMDGPILRYSVRKGLLREADASGIGRFEANLIIAAVQHQVDIQK